MKLAAVLLLTLTALAQTPEIRGTVIEQGPNTPLAGADVTLYEFVPNGDTLDARVFKTIATDARGAFSFKPGHVGDFRLEVKKPGYVTPEDGRRNPGGDTFKLQLFLPAARPLQEVRVVLMNPSSLTGRVVDEDRKPVANFRVLMQPADSLLIVGRGTFVVTDADGNFTASKLPPGPYVVRIADEAIQGISIIDYTEADSKIVDEAIETAYWPGGVADPKAALPIPVPPGTPANIGTIVLHRARYYRAAVELTGECTTEEWTYALIKVPSDPRLVQERSLTGPCRKQFIFRNLAPGSYSLAVSVGKRENLRWALAPVTIANENVRARLVLSPPTDLTIRFITADGTPLPRFPQMRSFLPSEIGNQPPPALPTRVLLRAEDAQNVADMGQIVPDGDGVFVARSLPWARYSVSVPGVPPSHYIKEMRYNRQLFTDGLITLAPGGLLEIVLSDRPASIAGIVKDGSLPSHGVVILDRWPPRPGYYEGNEPFSYVAPAAADGTFQISGLAPGDYRIRAVTTTILDTSAVDGERITLGLGDRKTIELKLLR